MKIFNGGTNVAVTLVIVIVYMFILLGVSWYSTKLQKKVVLPASYLQTIN